MSYFLGIDVSTTATKALLLDPAGGVVGVAATEYDYEAPRPLWSEQDPALWWEATARSVRVVLRDTGIAPAEIGAIGLTGQMHGLVLLDAVGRVLRPAILWNDQRTAAECDEIRRRVGRERLIERTGNDALTGFTAPKLLWVREHEPESTRRSATSSSRRTTSATASPARSRPTGPGAAGTLLLDLRRRDWSAEVLDALDVPAELDAGDARGPGRHGRSLHRSGRGDGPRGGHARSSPAAATRRRGPSAWARCARAS